MKRHLLYACITLGLFAAPWSLPAASLPLAGDYAAGPLTLRLDEAHHVQLRSGNEVLVDGNYTIDGDRITFTDEKGPMACDAKQPGEYRIAASNDALSFHVISDPCEGRAQDLPAHPWTRSR